jgi:hypothetical protein
MQRAKFGYKYLNLEDFITKCGKTKKNAIVFEEQKISKPSFIELVIFGGVLSNYFLLGFLGLNLVERIIYYNFHLDFYHVM